MYYCANFCYNPIRHDGVIAPEMAFFHNFCIWSLFLRELKEIGYHFKNQSCKTYWDALLFKDLLQSNKAWWSYCPWNGVFHKVWYLDIISERTIEISDLLKNKSCKAYWDALLCKVLLQSNKTWRSYCPWNGVFSQFFYLVIISERTKGDKWSL